MPGGSKKQRIARAEGVPYVLNSTDETKAEGKLRQPRMAVSLCRAAPKDGLSSAAARSKFHLSRPKQEGKGSIVLIFYSPMISFHQAPAGLNTYGSL